MTHLKVYMSSTINYSYHSYNISFTSTFSFLYNYIPLNSHNPNYYNPYVFFACIIFVKLLKVFLKLIMICYDNLYSHIEHLTCLILL